jgi:hypothetical protein
VCLADAASAAAALPSRATRVSLSMADSVTCAFGRTEARAASLFLLSSEAINFSTSKPILFPRARAAAATESGAARGSMCSKRILKFHLTSPRLNTRSNELAAAMGLLSSRPPPPPT